MNAFAEISMRFADPVASVRSKPKLAPALAADTSAPRNQDEVAAPRCLADRIERARHAFVARAHAKIERAAELTSSLDPKPLSPADPALAELQTLAHSLSGTAGSFGYGRLSEIAGRLEEAILSGAPQHHRILGLVIDMGAEFVSRVGGRQLDFVR